MGFQKLNSIRNLKFCWFFEGQCYKFFVLQKKVTTIELELYTTFFITLKTFLLVKEDLFSKLLNDYYFNPYITAV